MDEQVVIASRADAKYFQEKKIVKEQIKAGQFPEISISFYNGEILIKQRAVENIYDTVVIDKEQAIQLLKFLTNTIL